MCSMENCREPWEKSRGSFCVGSGDQKAGGWVWGTKDLRGGDVARLTEKQERFVAEYLVDLNATQAAIRAGYSPNRASEIGYQLLQKTTVQAAIQKAMDERSKRTGITQDRVLQELAAIGFSKATDFAQIRGGAVRLTETDELADEQKRAVAGIKEGKYGIELKLHDKIHALHLIGQHLGMFGGKANEPEPPADDGFVEALRGEAAEVWHDE